jgi:hypothetical protein
MSLRKAHIEKIAGALVRAFHDQKALSASDDVALAKIQFLISQNMDEERAIEDEAHRLLEKNRRAFAGDIDEQKAFQLIKKQIAKQKGFTL